MDGLRHFAHGIFKKAAESVTGPLKTSQFDEKRVRLIGARPLAAPAHASRRGRAAPQQEVEPRSRQTTLVEHHQRARLAAAQVLTPQEFVDAGDFLVRACPTWSW